MKDLVAVIDNLKRKRDRLPGHEDIRPLLLILPGGMRGAAGAGAILALHQAGLSDVFETVVGISTGAPTAAYFLSGYTQALQGASLYYQDLATTEFINLRRVKNIMRLELLLEVMASGQKAIDQVAIQSAPADFYMGMTTVRGEQKFINAKTARPSLLSAIHASMAMPGTGGQPVIVNGEAYVDGGLYPFPLHSIIRQFAPTDVLVIPNFPQPPDGVFHLTLKDFFASLFVLRTGSLTLTKLAILRRRKLTAGLRATKTVSPIRVGILWPPTNPLHHFTIDATTLRAATLAAGQAALTAFGSNQSLRVL